MYLQRLIIFNNLRTYVPIEKLYVSIQFNFYENNIRHDTFINRGNK